MFRFKFDQNRTKNKEFDFFEGQGRGEEEGDVHFKIVLSIEYFDFPKKLFIQDF